ncbi:MAG: rhodanese-like domain-containing protein, partial [Bacteroidales bacterium]|nr:rhodanese-like domain-containing protein [Bacteroidales bacterium]
MNIRIVLGLVVAVCVLLCLSVSACGKKPAFVSVDADTFALEIVKDNVQLLDVRTAEEFAQGRIPSAINMDVNAENFDEMIKSLDKNKTVALYCRSGRRSKIAAEKVA